MRRIAGVLVLLAVGIRPAAAVDLATTAEEFVENATYQAEVFSTGFMETIQNQSSKIDDKRIQFYSRIEAETFAAITDELYLNYKMQAIGTTGRGEARGFFTPPGNERPENRWIDVNHAYLSYEPSDYMVTVGKAPVEVGLSTLYSPVDRFAFVAGANPLHAEKFGQWQARADYYIEDDTVSFFVFPFEEREESPSGESRWLGNSGDDSFFAINIPGQAAGAPLTIEERFRDPSVDNFAYLMKYSGVREGFDFYALWHLGPSIYPVLQTTPTPGTFLKTKPWAFSPAVGIATTIEEWEFHADAILQHTFDQEDQNFIKYVVGASYRETELANEIGLEEIMPVVEFSHDLVIARQENAGFVATSALARPHRESILARISFRRDDEWSFRVGGSYNFRDHDSSLGAQLVYEPDDNTEIRLSTTFYAGPDDTQFGRWRKNDHVQLGIIRSF